MPKIKVLKVIKRGPKEIKKETAEKSELEEELEESQEESFSDFMLSRGSLPMLSSGGLDSSEVPQDVPRNAPGEPVVPEQEQESMSGTELYRTGRGLGDQRQAYTSSTATTNLLDRRSIGPTIQSASDASGSPENQLMNRQRTGLEREELGEKYEPATPTEEAKKKFKYDWE